MVFFLGRLRVPTRRCDLVVPADWGGGVLTRPRTDFMWWRDDVERWSLASYLADRLVRGSGNRTAGKWYFCTMRQGTARTRVCLNRNTTTTAGTQNEASMHELRTVRASLLILRILFWMFINVSCDGDFVPVNACQPKQDHLTKVKPNSYYASVCPRSLGMEIGFVRSI